MKLYQYLYPFRHSKTVYGKSHILYMPRMWAREKWVNIDLVKRMPPIRKKKTSPLSRATESLAIESGDMGMNEDITPCGVGGGGEGEKLLLC